jgi:hypothetical protein
MRVEPAEKIVNTEVLPHEEKKVILQVKINRVTRVLAIIIAFLSTFIFFIKILYF